MTVNKAALQALLKRRAYSDRPTGPPSDIPGPSRQGTRGRGYGPTAHPYRDVPRTGKGGHGFNNLPGVPPTPSADQSGLGGHGYGPTTETPGRPWSEVRHGAPKGSVDQSGRGGRGFTTLPSPPGSPGVSRIGIPMVSDYKEPDDTVRPGPGTHGFDNLPGVPDMPGADRLGVPVDKPDMPMPEADRTGKVSHPYNYIPDPNGSFTGVFGAGKHGSPNARAVPAMDPYKPTTGSGVVFSGVLPGSSDDRKMPSAPRVQMDDTMHRTDGADAMRRQGGPPGSRDADSPWDIGNVPGGNPARWFGGHYIPGYPCPDPSSCSYGDFDYRRPSGQGHGIDMPPPKFGGWTIPGGSLDRDPLYTGGSPHAGTIHEINNHLFGDVSDSGPGAKQSPRKRPRADESKGVSGLMGTGGSTGSTSAETYTKKRRKR